MTDGKKERHVRLRGALIRKRFERHAEAVRRIVANLSDEQLCAMEDSHHTAKCKHLAAQSASRRVAINKVEIL
jgi:pyruvate dehydrogenase complex dehydrogenase (E1) component